MIKKIQNNAALIGIAALLLVAIFGVTASAAPDAVGDVERITVYQASSQSISNATTTDVKWDCSKHRSNNNIMWSGNNCTAPWTDQTKIFIIDDADCEIDARMEYDNRLTDSHHYIYIKINGNIDYVSGAFDGKYSDISVNARLKANDQVQIAVHQVSGGTEDLDGGYNSNYMSIVCTEY